MFKYIRDELLQTISESDMQRMAWQVADDTGYEDLKASDTWLLNFKRHYNIGLWKVTVFKTRVQQDCQQHIVQTAADYVSGIQQILPTFDYKYVCNADQSGFQLEMHRPRTLAVKGRKKIEAVAMNINAMTHSFNYFAGNIGW